MPPPWTVQQRRRRRGRQARLPPLRPLPLALDVRLGRLLLVQLRVEPEEGSGDGPVVVRVDLLPVDSSIVKHVVFGTRFES